MDDEKIKELIQKNLPDLNWNFIEIIKSPLEKLKLKNFKELGIKFNFI